MNRRLLGWTALVSTVSMLLGLLVLDRPLAEWLRTSGLEQLPVFAHPLGALDVVVGIDVWVWLAGWTAFALGCLGLALQRRARWPRAFLAAWAVQVATLSTMILGKNVFGRLRPQQVLDAGDWTQPLWFAGGGSFPSGHSAFYFGLLLPLAAACPNRWLRALLLAIPLYVVLARIDLARHFLSDVAASALIAALYALLLATAARRWLPAPAAAPRNADPAAMPAG